jgi:hypothetical protein
MELLNTRKRQLKLFEHLKRHNILLKDILEGKIKSKRSRGRKRIKWTDMKRKRLTEKTISATPSRQD